jgi:NADH dehydrogenase
MKVLVAGGTGRLGKLVVERLAGHGADVRVLTRDPGRAEPLRALGVEVVQGDVRQPETLPAAVAGVDAVVSAVQGFAGSGKVTPRSVDQDGNRNLVGAARDGGNAAIVLLSIVGAAEDSPMELFRCKYAAEQAVRASGLPWTIIRATAFVELWSELVGHGIVFGRGDNPINFVSVVDVADLVVQSVLDADLRGQVIEIGGPRGLSFNELAAILRELRGAPKRVRHIPRPVLRAMARLHRQPAAALVMDTADMTYRPGPGGRTGATDVRVALAGPGGDG